jgi:hypothetical protein
VILADSLARARPVGVGAVIHGFPAGAIHSANWVELPGWTGTFFLLKMDRNRPGPYKN